MDYCRINRSSGLAEGGLEGFYCNVSSISTSSRPLINDIVNTIDMQSDDSSISTEIPNDLELPVEIIYKSA